MTQVGTEVATQEPVQLQGDGSASTAPGSAKAHTRGRSHRQGLDKLPPPYHLDRLGWIGVGLLLLQGAAMLAWSTLLWHRFALGGFDYGIYHQAWWLIAHGHLDPFDTVLGFPFWQNNFELMMWPLALIGVIWPHGPVLLWIQDACLVGAEIVVWRWMRETTTSRLGGQNYGLAGVGLTLLLANPWAWLSISFDFHMELIAILFVVLAAYDLDHGRRRAWLWVALTLLCGNGEAAWIAGLGIASVVLRPRHSWGQGLALAAIGVTWVGLAVVVHGDRGGNVAELYGYFAGKGSTHASLVSIVFGAITHPQRALSALFSHRVAIWANLAPGGFIGILNPWTFGLALPVLVTNELLRGQTPFASPLFQSALLYVIMPLGTVLVLIRVYGPRRRLALGIGTILVVNALLWSVIWAPYIPERWLRVPTSSAALLAHADALAPSSAEIVVSNGVAGRFADRPLVYPILSPSQLIPLQARLTWWVIAPSLGVESDPVVDQAALVAELAGPLHAHLILQARGVWVFQWLAPGALRSLTLPGPSPTTEAAVSFPGPVGQAVVEGPASNWHVASAGSAGYVLSGDYWRDPPGLYKARVQLATTVPADVEVWNATGHVLLARRIVPTTNGIESVSVTVDAKRLYPHHAFEGWGPFQGGFPGPPHDDQLEIRVWTPGGGVVDIEQIQLREVNKT